MKQENGDWAWQVKKAMTINRTEHSFFHEHI
jgi:hypothetical protein